MSQQCVCHCWALHIYMGPACFAKAFSVGTCQPRAREEAPGFINKQETPRLRTRPPLCLLAAPLLDLYCKYLKRGAGVNGVGFKRNQHNIISELHRDSLAQTEKREEVHDALPKRRVKRRRVRLFSFMALGKQRRGDILLPNSIGLYLWTLVNDIRGP